MTTDPWTESLLLAALAKRFDAPAYAFLRHVPNATGGRADKTIDAVAMGLWPSRGLDLHGFEIKTSRNDWRRELANPAKAEGWPFDFFWLVTPLDLVPIRDVPTTWGVIEASNTARGVKLTVTKDAPQQKKKPISRLMLAALMRKVHYEATAHDDREAAKKEGYDNGYRDGLAKGDAAQVRVSYQRLREQIDAFTAHSGIAIDQWTDGAVLGERVKIARRLNMLAVNSHLASMGGRLRTLLADIATAQQEIADAAEKILAAKTESRSGGACEAAAAEHSRPTDEAEKTAPA